MENVNLRELASGAVQEKFEQAMEKVIANMQDQNTPWKNKRHIIIHLTFEQNEDRNDTMLNVAVDIKTAPVKPVTTRMAIGMDLKTGKPYAQEYGSQVRGQMSFTTSPQMPSELLIDGKVVETSTGEIKETENVVDFRAAREA